MAGMNGVIHFVAALALVGLAFLWIRARKRHDFLRLVLGLGAGKVILVEWPEKFIRSVADACGILISGTSCTRGSQPVTIDLREWRAFLRSFEVSSFCLGQGSDGEARLLIEVSADKVGDFSSEEEIWGRRLSKTLRQTVEVHFTVPGK